jgi:hypothetical protein
VRASTAETTEVLNELLKFIGSAPQRQTASVAAGTHGPTASPSAATQVPSVPASPAPKPAPKPASEIAPSPSAPEPMKLPQTPGQPAPVPDPAPEPISTVARCTTAYNKARSASFTRSTSHYDADQAGAKAFRGAMPSLLGGENIRDFIACVAHGMLIGAIENNDATKLLYAAQVAFSAQNRTEPKRTPKSAAKVTPTPPENN